MISEKLLLDTNKVMRISFISELQKNTELNVFENFEYLTGELLNCEFVYLNGKIYRYPYTIVINYCKLILRFEQIILLPKLKSFYRLNFSLICVFI